MRSWTHVTFLILCLISARWALAATAPQPHGVELAELHPQLFWQRVSPTSQRPEGPVLYQIQLTLGQPNTVPKYDSSGRHFAASKILDNGTTVAIGGFSVDGATGIITFASGQTFPGSAGSLPLTGGTMTGNITFAGTQTFPGSSLTGIVPIANGGTALNAGPTVTPSPIVPAQFLRGSAPGSWSVSAIQASDVPGLPYLSLAGGHVTGGLTVDGNVTLKSNLFLNTSSLLELPGGANFASAQATSGGGTNSSGLELDASAWNTSVPGSETERFVWQAEPVNDITANPTGKLSLLFGNTRPIPLSETGLSIGSNGQIAFAGGQKAPAIANQKFIAKAAAIGSTTLLTAGSADGLFRISIYAVTTTTDTGGGAPAVTPSLSWTDDSGAQTTSFSPIDLTKSGSLSQATFVLQGKANAAVSFSTAVAGSVTNGQYSFYITAEQIL